LSIGTTGPNAEMISYWNESSGAKWVRNESVLDEQIAPVGILVMDRAVVTQGERAIDVGCGCGQTCLQLGERVGPAGSVLGVDISAVMLERAAQRAAERGLEQVHFANVDAQTHDFEPASADLVFSRFGVMFFADPSAAFRNLHSALVPDGRLAFACWQALDRNPWMLEPVRAAAQLVPLPAPREASAPGPFSFADPDRVRAILSGAGFRNLEFESHERELTVGGGLSLDGAVDFLLQLGPLGAALREAGDAAETLLPKVREAVRRAVEPHSGDDGIHMDSASWIVTASAG
jgi:SAM-dependent methyltransferase